MKQLFLTFSLVFSFFINAQDLKQSTKLFSTKELKVGFSLGADASWAGKTGKTGMVNPLGNIKNDNLYFPKTPNLSYTLGVDIYSSLSTLGFYIEGTINQQKLTILEQNGTKRDSINNTNIEIPLYLKLRIGKLESLSHFWFALGGGYSFISKSQTILTDDYNTYSLTGNSKDLFNNHVFLSTLLGYELIVPFEGTKGEKIYNRDNFRVLLFIKANYDLGNRLNNDYYIENSALHTFENPELKFLRFSFGIKVFMRISGLASVASKVLKEGLTH